MNHRNGLRRFAGIFALGFGLVAPLAINAAEEAANTEKPWKCTLRLLDPEGKPVAGGKVTAYQNTKEWTPGMQAWELLTPANPRETVSDQNGYVTIGYPEKPAKALFIEVHVKGFVPLRYVFGENELFIDLSGDSEIPREFDVHLSPGVPAGGVVRGHDGKPVEGAVVVVLATGDLSETAGSPEPLDTFSLVLKTDATGKWACRVPRPDEDWTQMPTSGLSESETARVLRELNDGCGVDDAPVTVTVIHPDYALKKTHCLPEELFSFLKAHKELLCALGKAGCVAGTTFDVVLENGVDLTGRVVDESGKPLENTRILLRAEADMIPRIATAETGKDGRFVVRHLVEEPLVLFASRDGFAPCIRSVMVGADTAPLRLVVKKGRQFKLAVRDSSGKAVCAEVDVRIEEEVLPDLPLGLPAKTDAEGNWTWNSAPKKPCSYTISADGFDTVLRDLPPGEHTITLKRPGFIIGRVIDAETKTPIERFFVSRKKVIENDYFTFSDSDWKNLFVTDAADGVFRCACPEGPKLHVTRTFTVDAGDGPETVELPEPKYLGVIFRVEAEGYMPILSKTLPWREKDVEVTFEMKKAAPITGRIVDAKGRPVVGAEIVVTAEDLPGVRLDSHDCHGFYETLWPSQEECRKSEMEPGHMVFSFNTFDADEEIPKQPRHTRSDKTGRFTLFAQKAPYELIVAHKDGFARVPDDPFESGSDIVLTAWASLEGVVTIDGKPLPYAEIEIAPKIPVSTVRAGFAFPSIGTETDERGRFKVDRLPPLEVTIKREIEDEDSIDTLNLKTLTLSPGENKKVRLDGNTEEEN